MNASSIQVVVRLRPMNSKESKHSTLPVIKASTVDKTVTVIKGHGARQARTSFSFDNVFTAFSSQEEVFEATLKPVIRDVLAGYESTIFAYGQTGTGKTHTMEGSLTCPELYGVIPRSAQAIFEAVKQPDFENTLIQCSYLEIYNEDLGDLLLDDNGDELSCGSGSTSPSRKKRTTSPSKRRERHVSSPIKVRKSKLEIMEGPDGPFCRGLKEVDVTSATDVLNLMQNAQQLRKVGETKMNKHSSRSHCLFTLKVKSQRRLKDGSVIDFCGKLHMVDLAGSECAKSAGCEKGSIGGEQVSRERERMNINRSLLTLGRVIKLLKEQSEKGSNKKNNVRIPYRDSKLTRILQESLGGRCKTLIVATLSPSVTAIEESLSTLHYAQSANGIVNKPISSSKMSVTSIAFPSDAGSTEPGSVDTWYEMECRLEYMQSQVEEAQAALARKHMLQQELVERSEKAEADLVSKKTELFEAKDDNERLGREVVSEREQKEALAVLQQKTEIALKKTTAILEATKCTEVSLTNEAEDVLGSLERSIEDGEILHCQLSEARDDVVRKRSLTKNFHDATVLLLNTIVIKLEDLSTMEEGHKASMMNLAATGRQREEAGLSNTIEMVQAIKQDVERMMNSIKEHINGDEGMSGLLSNMASVVEEKSQIAKSSIEVGEDALSAAFDDALERLQDYSSQIKNMNSDFLISSQAISSLVEAKISKSREKLSAFVSLAIQSLGDVSDANAKSRDQLSSVLRDISESTASSSMTFLQHADSQCEQLSSSMKSFESGMRHDSMNSELEQQNLILKDQGQTHLREIFDLKEVIKSQQLSFELAAVKQRAVQEETLNNIFKGVQNLVIDGIGTLAQSNESVHKTFTATNAAMMQANNATKLSAESTFSGIKAATDSLQRDVELARENDAMIGLTVREASSTIDELANVVKSHRSHTESAVGRGTTHVEDLRQHSEEMSFATEKLILDKDSVVDFISDTVLVEAKAGVESLCKSTTELSEFASNAILSNVQNDINAMRKPRAEWKFSTVDCVEKIASAVQGSSDLMSSAMESQDRTASELVQIVNSKYDDFVTVQSLARRQEIEMHEDCIMSETEKHMSSSVEVIVKCASELKSTEEHVVDHSKNDMECDEYVKPLPKKLKIDFNSNFTSTPADHEIIEGLDLSLEQSTMREHPEKDVDEKSMKSVEESLIENIEDLDEHSMESVGGRDDIISQASAHFPCPPITNASRDKENILNRTRSRSSSTGRSKSTTGKRRADSRPRANSTRKRVPNISTPVKG